MYTPISTTRTPRGGLSSSVRLFDCCCCRPEAKRKQPDPPPRLTIETKQTQQLHFITQTNGDTPQPQVSWYQRLINIRYKEVLQILAELERERWIAVHGYKRKEVQLRGAMQKRPAGTISFVIRNRLSYFGGHGPIVQRSDSTEPIREPQQQEYPQHQLRTATSNWSVLCQAQPSFYC